MRKHNEFLDIAGENTVEMSFPNKLGYERIAMECSASYAKSFGFPQDRIEDLKTAVSEACLNAIEHGNKSHPETRVTVLMSYCNEVLSVSVVDEGKGIEKMPQEPDILKQVEKLQSPRGLGIFLITKLMDQVEFNKMTREGHMVRFHLKMKM